MLHKGGCEKWLTCDKCKRETDNPFTVSSKVEGWSSVMVGGHHDYKNCGEGNDHHYLGTEVDLCPKCQDNTNFLELVEVAKIKQIELDRRVSERVGITVTCPNSYDMLNIYESVE